MVMHSGYKMLISWKTGSVGCVYRYLQVSVLQFKCGCLKFLMHLFVVPSRGSRAAQNPVGWSRERAVPRPLRWVISGSHTFSLCVYSMCVSCVEFEGSFINLGLYITPSLPLCFSYQHPFWPTSFCDLIFWFHLIITHGTVEHCNLTQPNNFHLVPQETFCSSIIPFLMFPVSPCALQKA